MSGTHRRPRKSARFAALTAVAVTGAVVLSGVQLEHGVTPTTNPVVGLRLTGPGQVVVDGQPTKLIVSTKKPLSTQLRDIYPRAVVRLSRSGDREQYVVHTPQQVKVAADGNDIALSTTATTAKGALDQAGVQLHPLDQVSVTGHLLAGPLPTPLVVPPAAGVAARPATPAGVMLPATHGADAALTGGETVRVVRVHKISHIVTTAIAATTIRHTVTSLPPGTRRIAAPGKPGQRRTRVTVVTHDNRVVSRTRTLLSTTPAVSRVVEVGAPLPTPAATHPTSTLPQPSGSLNWAALARCESSGNPHARNPLGYYGLYQFNLGTWASVGGAGNPADASPAEQTSRAQQLYATRGTSPWPVCGKYL